MVILDHSCLTFLGSLHFILCTLHRWSMLRSYYSNPSFSLMPIFHCNATHFVLGPRVGLYTQRNDFALGIQHVGIQKVSRTQRDPLIGLYTQRDPLSTQREQVEYRSLWVPSRWGSRWACTFHVVSVDFVRVG